MARGTRTTEDDVKPSMQDLIDRAVSQLAQGDMTVTPEEVAEAIAIVNHQPSGLVKLAQHARKAFKMTAKEAVAFVDVIAPIAHEALDIEFMRGR